MEFEYRLFQKAKRELEVAQGQLETGENVDLESALTQAKTLIEMVDALRFRDQQLGIYNVSYWMNRVVQAIATGRMNRFDACYFDLKSFSLVNDAYGRQAGTEIIKRYVGRLQDLLEEEEFVCRAGSDNFALLFYKEHLDMVREYLEGQDISVDGTEDNLVHIETTAGYYIIPDLEPLAEPCQIMDRIVEAHHVAKDVRHVPLMFWNDEMMVYQEHRKNIENVFKESINKGEFQVFYQPKVNLKDYSLTGAEALCRWMHDGKIVPPDEFIPVLEQSYHICELDFYMLEHVCQDIQRWRREGRRIVKISVNLSRRHLENEHLLEQVMQIIDKYEVPHQYIEIELTETIKDVGFQDLRRIVSGLQEQDVSASVDDFGVGYSSLNLIRELPWNVLKIDKSFLPAVYGTDVRKDTIFRQLVALAQSLDLECIVEGVETAEQVRILKRNKCYLAQGFFFDRPLPVNEFERRMAVCEG